MSGGYIRKILVATRGFRKHQRENRLLPKGMLWKENKSEYEAHS